MTVTITATDGAGTGEDGIGSVRLIDLISGADLATAIETDVAGTYEAIFTPSSVGVLRLQAIALDLSGNESYSELVVVSVTQGLAPVVESISADAPDPTRLTDVVTLTIEASDADGSVDSVEVFNGTSSLGFASPVSVDGVTGVVTYNFEYAANAVGLVSLRAQLTDNTGNVTSSDVVELAVFTGTIPTVSIAAVSDTSVGTLLNVDVTVDNGAPEGLLSLELWQADPVNGDSVFGALSPIGSSNVYRYSALLRSADLGLYNLYAVAVDARGNRVESPIERFNVVTGNVAAVAITTVDDTASVLNE